MKKLCYLAGTAMALCFGCSERNPVILFSSPQPSDAREIGSFPEDFLGEFSSGSDSNLLSVRSDGMYRVVRYRSVSHVNELDSGSELIGDTLVRDRMNKLDHPVTRIGDSLLVDMQLTDTLFRFDDKHQLRKFRNTYILNSRHEQGWQLSTLERKKNQLIWSRLDDEEAASLKDLSDAYTDSVPYQFQLRSSRFKKFLRSEGFKDADTFIVRNPSLKAQRK